MARDVPADPGPAGPAARGLPSPVALVGLGLMGGSLARSLARLDDPPTVVGWSGDPADVDRALEAGVVHEGADDPVEAAAAGALVVYAVPLGALLEMLPDHAAVWREDAVITDVASLKAPVISRMRRLHRTDSFVGGHPMTGGTGTGFGASRRDLYGDARVWLTDDTGDADARAAVEGLWEAVGARPRWVDARSHDRRMVWCSHLPQLVANGLARALDGQGIPRHELGPGGRDMTRLAGSSPDMWSDLFAEAGAEDARALEELGGVLHALARDLREGRLDEVEELMETTRRWTRTEEST